jgi:hypothetical protein
MVRSEVDYTQQLCDTCSKELAKEFKDWWVVGKQVLLLLVAVPFREKVLLRMRSIQQFAVYRIK